MPKQGYCMAFKTGVVQIFFAYLAGTVSPNQCQNLCPCFLFQVNPVLDPDIRAALPASWHGTMLNL